MPSLVLPTERELDARLVDEDDGKDDDEGDDNNNNDDDDDDDDVTNYNDHLFQNVTGAKIYLGFVIFNMFFVTYFNALVNDPVEYYDLEMGDQSDDTVLDEPYVCDGIHNALFCNTTTCFSLREFMGNEISKQSDSPPSCRHETMCT